MSDHPGYAYLGSHRWVRRDQIPDFLLAEYDARCAVAENNPSATDLAKGRTSGGLWLDVIDQICEQVSSVLDRSALLEDRELRNRAELRALSAVVAPTKPARP